MFTNSTEGFPLFDILTIIYCILSLDNINSFWVKSYFNVVLLCISWVMTDIEHFFQVHVGHLNVFFWEMNILINCLFLIRLFLFIYLFIYLLLHWGLISWPQALYHLHHPTIPGYLLFCCFIFLNLVWYNNMVMFFQAKSDSHCFPFVSFSTKCCQKLVLPITTYYIS
jgi:hypothetical protein